MTTTSAFDAVSKDSCVVIAQITPALAIAIGVNTDTSPDKTPPLLLAVMWFAVSLIFIAIEGLAFFGIQNDGLAGTYGLVLWFLVAAMTAATAYQLLNNLAPGFVGGGGGSSTGF